MTHRARITQATIKRAIRAARQEGALKVEVSPEGKIIIDLSPQSPQYAPETIEEDGEIVL